MKETISNIKKLLAVIMVLALVSSAICTQTTNAASGNTNKLSISKTSLKLRVNVKYKLSINGTTKKPVWKSSNKRVAKVYQTGVVKALKPGKAVISAKVGKKTYKCTVRVYSGKFKHKHKYKEKIRIDESFLILDPPIFPILSYFTATGHFINGDSSDGIVYYSDDMPETWFNYGNDGDIVYDGIYCTGKLIDKSHFKRDTLRNNNENVGNVALVTGKNSRIIDLNKLDWYCIHNRTTSYNECIFCGDIKGGDYYCRDAMLYATIQLDNSEDDDKKYYSPNCTCKEFAIKQYGRCFFYTIDSEEKNGAYVTRHLSKPKISFSRCKHKNGADFYYTAADKKNRYKCNDCGAIFRKSDLK